MQGLRRTKSVVGLDLGAGAVKAVELTQGALRSCAFAPHTQGENLTTRSMAAAIGSALRQAAPRATRVVVGLNAAEVIVHRFALPRDLPSAEIEEQARAQAGQAVPYPLDEARYDYVEEGRGERNLSYCMGIAKMEAVQALCRPVEDAGLKVAAVDITPFAIQRAVSIPGSEDSALAVLDGGHRQTRLALYPGNGPVFQHSYSFGCAELAERLRRTYGLSKNDTLKAMEECALPGGQVSRIRESFLRDLARHTERALQLYLASRHDIRAPERTVLWGGAALLHGACEVLEEALGMPVGIAAPPDDSGDGRKAPGFSPALLGAYALALNDHA